MLAMIRMVGVLAAIFAAVPACAETYKWVNDNGVTTYSDAPPPGARAVKKFEIVPDRISVIPQDRSVMRSVEDSAHRDARNLQLERELAAARGAGGYPAVAGATQAAYQRCVADRRVDCDLYGNDGYDTGGYGDYTVPYYVIGAAFRPRAFVSGFSVRRTGHSRSGGAGHSR
jgi:hypothetical protein